jgi:hypothetical protein
MINKIDILEVLRNWGADTISLMKKELRWQ